MIETLDNGWYQSKSLMFKDKGKFGEKTRYWEVLSRPSLTHLGAVLWYSRWRRYCFYPSDKTLYDSSCLEALSEFCKDRTNDQKKNWKPAGRPAEPKYEKLLVPRKKEISQTEGWIGVIKEMGKENGNS